MVRQETLAVDAVQLVVDVPPGLFFAKRNGI